MAREVLEEPNDRMLPDMLAGVPAVDFSTAAEVLRFSRLILLVFLFRLELTRLFFCEGCSFGRNTEIPAEASVESQQPAATPLQPNRTPYLSHHSQISAALS